MIDAFSWYCHVALPVAAASSAWIPWGYLTVSILVLSQGQQSKGRTYTLPELILADDRGDNRVCLELGVRFVYQDDGIPCLDRHEP